MLQRGIQKLDGILLDDGPKRGPLSRDALDMEETGRGVEEDWRKILLLSYSSAFLNIIRCWK